MNNKKTTPDYGAGLTYGGELKELIEPLTFYYPGPHKRPVECRVSSYSGYCPGAVHYYACIKERDNSAWSEKEGRWVTPWGEDSRFIGANIEEKFLTWEDAMKWCRCVVREKFDKKTHAIEFNDITDSGPIPVFFWEEREIKPEPFRETPESLTAYYHRRSKI